MTVVAHTTLAVGAACRRRRRCCGIERMQARRDELVQEYRGARENRIGGEYRRDERGIWRPRMDDVDRYVWEVKP